MTWRIVTGVCLLVAVAQICFAQNSALSDANEAAAVVTVEQVASPVLWEDVVRYLASSGVTTYVEVGPGRVLSGLVRKMVDDADVYAVGEPDDVETLLARPVR